MLPAYNEESGIASIANRVLAVRPKLLEAGIDSLELLIVDDGSSDRTAEIAQSVDGVRLLRHAQNQGYGAALKTGFENAKGDLIGFLDADGTYPPEYFPELCKAAINGGDLVIGSRMAGADSQMPITRRIGNMFFASLLTVIGRQRVSDSASGMRVFKRDILDVVYPLPNGLNLTPVMSVIAIHEGLNMVEVPIPYSERIGRSKLSVVHDGSLFLHSIIWTALIYNPVRILGLVGLAGMAVAALIALGLVLARASGVTDLGPWGIVALYIALVSGVIGTTIFALGVLFNYLVSLFHKRPVRQGLFGKPLLKSKPLEQSFGWMGLASTFVGLLIGLISAVLGVSGWEISRLWLYLLGSAMLILVGVQLIIYWVLVRILYELSQREVRDVQEVQLIT